MPELPKNCDLHIHSVFSDSDMPLEAIFKEAKQQKLVCIAITDHDTLDGFEQAQKYSITYGIELIPAIELSANYEDTEVHILGYFIDTNNKELKKELQKIKTIRLERISSMADKLNALGVSVDKAELLSKIKGAIPTRLHLALYLVEKKKVENLSMAFKKYLSPGKPAYIARFKYSVKEAIEVIKSYGGLAFLAHPHMISNQSWIEEFISLGLNGLEVVYPNLSTTKSSLYEGMVNRFNLLRCGGSDAHGSYKQYTFIGSAVIPYSWIEDMKKCLTIST
ncbi:MAG: PHP domain-containing protein [Candidatus Omnitrophica bacterium]|jgi:predicted metal-dependent phosphoesterase TrpH|nr:PHP domain-containing protein [Candidatus Omnitrophota bacterium]